MYIVGAGQEIDTNVGILRDGLLCLMYSYYAWDLSYPKNYQLLGFLQHYILKDSDNKFFTSQNYMKFCKPLMTHVDSCYLYIYAFRRMFTVKHLSEHTGSAEIALL